MTWSWLIEGMVAFVASNVDELLVSVMQFGEAVRGRGQDSNPPRNRQQKSEDHLTAPTPTERTPLQPSGVYAHDTETLHVWQVVLGQLVGFTLILLLSLAGYALGALVERPWIGLLGLLPIALGIKELVGECRKLCRKPRAAAPPKETLSETNPDAPHRLAINDTHTPLAASSWSALRTCCSTRTLQVASIAFASGSDSIGVYVPLFASSTIGQMIVLVLLFYLMFFLWMWLAYKLVHFRIVASLIKEYGEFVGPVLLILLGVYILYDCHTVNLYYRYTR